MLININAGAKQGTYRVRKDGQIDKRYKYGRSLGTTLTKNKVVTKGFARSKILEWLLIILFIATAIAYWYHNSTYTVSGVGQKIEFPQGFEFVDVAQAEEKTFEDYLCDPKYKWDCKKMIAICKAENGWTESRGWKSDATNNNTNGTWDYGFCQINEIHGYSKDYLVNMENHAQASYNIWVHQGYDAWVMHWNGGFERYL